MQPSCAVLSRLFSHPGCGLQEYTILYGTTKWPLGWPNNGFPSLLGLRSDHRHLCSHRTAACAPAVSCVMPQWPAGVQQDAKWPLG